ncbi:MULTISPECIES: hypothetical protein [unclassified Bradyrhizobium]|uniref:hypothetical protein n=1 Tax=unclassified Bradyrhizobium TaxID=2631580 RepID=UPI00247AE440|nr:MULTISPECIES: hypothetical protein [unclassified Bradyrhizobium]WGS23047.1 hypothetical protein MTX22_16225 [Bradyrhizobium sp. ISRA463]WGS30046.1 hypothetical protein MTX19_13950 [Bradyrhizobium sp. ISRA464]
MDRIDAMNVFVAVVDKGSLAGAAGQSHMLIMPAVRLVSPQTRRARVCPGHPRLWFSM